MSLPVVLGILRGDLRAVSAITIEVADLRDERGRRIRWLPGDLLVLDFDRNDLAVPAGWSEGRGEGHTIAYRWLTGEEVTATFYLPYAGVVEWRGYVLSNIQPSEVVPGGVVDP
jgi:hypothetical protein